MVFQVDVRFVEIDDKKFRLFSDAERHNVQRMLKELDEDDPQANVYNSWLKSDEDAMKLGTVGVEYLVCFVPSYEEKLLIKGNALAKMRQTCAPLDLDMSNEALEFIRLEVQAKTLTRRVVDSEEKEIVADWESIWNNNIWPESWRQQICGLVDMAITLSEEERTPLFNGPKAK